MVDAAITMIWQNDRKIMNKVGGKENKEGESRCYHRGGGGGGEQQGETGSRLSIAARGARQRVAVLDPANVQAPAADVGTSTTV